MTTQEKLQKLREWMQRHQISAVIQPNADPHTNEYQAPRWWGRQWLTGFKGSNGTLVVTLKEAGLWTDSRYYEAAEQAIEGTEIVLFRAVDPGVPTTTDWLKSVLEEGDVVAFDGGCISQSNAQDWVDQFAFAGIQCQTELDPLEIWEDRPAAPCGVIELVADEIAGETTVSKLSRLRAIMKQRKVDAYLLGRTDEANWLFNFRGTDMKDLTTPYCYGLVTAEMAEFFIHPGKLSEAARVKLANEGVTFAAYEAVYERLSVLEASTRLLMVPNYTNYRLYQAGAHCVLVKDRALVTDMKAVKNAVEMENFRKALIEDGAAMVRFYVWMYRELRAGRPVSELSASRQLEKCRAAVPGFRHVSFESIMGYRAHGSLNHYAVDESSDVALEEDGIFLIDSGGNYVFGTTDTTRVLPLGVPTSQEKMDYTLVLKCLIDLITVEFPVGTTGAQLDGICRVSMWQHHCHFGHGTGHGVGFGLEIHEGPQSISGRSLEEVKLGMVTTIEPGIYRPGSHGIRIENMVHTVLSEKSSFAQFLKFENLTFCPINVDLVEPSLLEDKHLNWLNAYNAEVFDKLSPKLDAEEVAWLRHETRSVSR